MKKKYLLIAATSFLVFTIIIGSSIHYYLGKFSSNKEVFDDIIRVNPELKPPDVEDHSVINVLFMGIDDARSDFMMIARYNKEDDKVAMISIPRDTRVEISNHGYDKINSAVAKKGGIPLAMDTVSKLLGIPIHYYVELSFKGMENIIDIIGGVEINVARDMYYPDPTQDLYINIKKGKQILNGKDSVDFVRYRSGYIDQDLGRIQAQQYFIKEFIKTITSPKMIPKAFNILQAMSQYVKTNMDEKEIAYYALKLKDLKMNNIKMYTLPGEALYINKISYYVYDEQKLREMSVEIEELLGIQKSLGEKPYTIEQNENSDIKS